MTSLEYPESLIKKARDLVSKAEEELKYSAIYSNVVLWCQEAIELSGKAIFKIMGLDFPKEHQLLFEERKERRGEIKSEVKELLKKEFPKYFAYKEDIPRVIFLTYFWYNFYTIAKYGMSEIDIPPDKLFLKEDAELALKHAKDCVKVADNLLIQKKVKEGK
jgi:HEPN domain-containing protein